MNDLVKRLRAKVKSGPPSWIEMPINPNGYEAADCIEQLEAHIKALLRYVPTGTVECRGDKCREPWCISCNGEEAAEVGLQQATQIADKARGAAK